MSSFGQIGTAKRAGPIRNAEIVAHAGRLVAFWKGRNRGMLNTILMARKREIPIAVFGAQGTPVALEAALPAAEALGVSAALHKGLSTDFHSAVMLKKT